MSIACFERVSAAQYLRDAEGREGLLPSESIPLPRRATAGSAGYDFVCTCALSLAPGESAVIPTGIRVRMEQGWVLLLLPRSSLGFKHNVRLSNTAGVIDGDYYGAANEGHILVKLFNGGDHAVSIQPGERFCQGIFLPFGLAREDGADQVRSGGLGSTGR